MATGDQSGGRRLDTVLQAFDIIEHVRTEGPSTLSEIATAFDMPMSTAHIHLTTLVETGYLVREDDEYRCSLRFLQTGGELRDSMPFYQVAKPEVDDLQQRLAENANLGTDENGYMIQLYKSEDVESIDDNAPLGNHMYLHSTALGKAILSHASSSEVDSIIERRGLPQITAATVKNRAELDEELAETRERGYSINNGEHFPGVRAVAVPIIVDDNEVEGAISLSGPQSRIDQGRIENELIPELREKQNIIELKLKQR